jgi:hypothetical protein
MKVDFLLLGLILVIACSLLVANATQSLKSTFHNNRKCNKVYDPCELNFVKISKILGHL